VGSSQRRQPCPLIGLDLDHQGRASGATPLLRLRRVARPQLGDLHLASWGRCPRALQKLRASGGLSVPPARRSSVLGWVYRRPRSKALLMHSRVLGSPLRTSAAQPSELSDDQDHEEDGWDTQKHSDAPHDIEPRCTQSCGSCSSCTRALAHRDCTISLDGTAGPPPCPCRCRSSLGTLRPGEKPWEAPHPGPLGTAGTR
jgi:hypothetical protein